MDQIFTFKDFLSANIGDVSVVLAVIVISFVVLLFAMREIVSWMARTHMLKSEIQNLSKQIAELHAEVCKHKNVTPEAAPDKNQKQFLTLMEKSEQERPSFPLN